MSGLSRRAFLFATATASGALLVSWRIARADQPLTGWSAPKMLPSVSLK